MVIDCEGILTVDQKNEPTGSDHLADSAQAQENSDNSDKPPYWERIYVFRSSSNVRGPRKYRTRVYITQHEKYF